MNNTIGYIICETASTEPTKPVIIDAKNGRVVIETILQDMNIKNRNGRWYSDKELLPQLTCPRTNELINAGGLPGEAGHPMSKDLARQQTIDPTNVSHKILKLWADGNDIKGTVRAARGPMGDTFNDEILDGTLVAFSLRALGSVNNTARGAEVQNVKVITWDWVYYPSHMRAYQQKIVTEGADLGLGYEKNPNGIFLPFDNQQVVKYIKDSSKRLHETVEALEFLYENIVVLENNRQVRLCDKDGNKLTINLESYICNELMDFAKNKKVNR